MNGMGRSNGALLRRIPSPIGQPKAAASVTMLTLKLPIPPSTNHLYANVPGRGRVKTKAYRAWIAEARLQNLRARKPPMLDGTIEVNIFVPVNRRRDIDNYGKPLLDFLQHMGVIKNDNRIDFLSIARDPSIKDHVMVHVFAGKA